MNFFSKVSVIFCYLFLSLEVASANLTLTQRKELGDLIKLELEKQGGPGIAVSATQNGKLVFAAAAGYKDVENKVPFTHDTRMSIGSISKTFTSLAIYNLIDKAEGRLTLETPVQSILGFLGYDFGEIKLRNLLDHTSGLQRSVGGDSIANLRSIWDKGIYSPEYSSIADILQQGVTLYEAPGVMAQYSNLAYSLLGLVVVEVAENQGYSFKSMTTDEKIAEYMRNEVFQPMGSTTHTDLMVKSRDKSNEGVGYGGTFGDRDSDPLGAVRFVWPRHQTKMGMALTHSGVMSDVIGLAKLQKFFYSKLTEKKETRNEIMSRQSFLNYMQFVARSLEMDEKASANKVNGTGGLFLEKMHLENGRTMYLIGHSGIGFGSRNISFLDPETGFGVNLIVNAKSFDRHAVAKIVLNYLSSYIEISTPELSPMIEKKLVAGVELLEREMKLTEEQKALLPTLVPATLENLQDYLVHNLNLPKSDLEETVSSLLENQYYSLSLGQGWNQSIIFTDEDNRPLGSWNEIRDIKLSNFITFETPRVSKIG